ATTEGGEVVSSLRDLSAIPGLSNEWVAEAGRLALLTEQFLAEADATYREVVIHEHIAIETQHKMCELAVRTEALIAALRRLKDRLTQELKDNLRMVQARSERNRSLATIVFLTSL